ncbi:uncharacterized protein LOC127263844 isoform X1 [Andrographis paniculata]|uniref:uncharacterized protein LOC127263844 isoform X1 n=1 Tax=Andrographis paniculata TaxID=175694 RepID=UPI0021E6DCD9|nr:uncharacterized protein LOC127263844 isoform X1 [Andrographis paniculata]
MAELESVRKSVEKTCEPHEFTVDSMPTRFIEPVVMQGLKVHRVQRGLILCSFTVPPRLLNTGNTLHGGATATLVDILGSAVIYTMGSLATGVSVEISVSYLDAAHLGFVGVAPMVATGPVALEVVAFPVTTTFSKDYNEKAGRKPSQRRHFPTERNTEEIEIESKALRVGRAIAVASVELRSIKTGKIIAQGRHTKYLTLQSKM